MGSLYIGRLVVYMRSSYNERLAGSYSHNCRGLLSLGNTAPRHYATLHLLGVFSQVAGMFQDPSVGDIKVYYVATKIIVLNSTEDQVRIFVFM